MALLVVAGALCACSGGDSGQQSNQTEASAAPDAENQSLRIELGKKYVLLDGAFDKPCAGTQEGDDELTKAAARDSAEAYKQDVIRILDETHGSLLNPDEHVIAYRSGGNALQPKVQLLFAQSPTQVTCWISSELFERIARVAISEGAQSPLTPHPAASRTLMPYTPPPQGRFPYATYIAVGDGGLGGKSIGVFSSTTSYDDYYNKYDDNNSCDPDCTRAAFGRFVQNGTADEVSTGSSVTVIGEVPDPTSDFHICRIQYSKPGGDLKTGFAICDSLDRAPD